MATYIYARVSTDGQTTDNQSLALLQRFPDAKVTTETASGGKNRPLLKALLSQLKKGDTLVVAALDRLGRKTTDVLTLIEDLQKRGINLISVREGVDYSTPVGRLVTQILASVAEMERAMISERTKAGLAAAKAKGKKLGKASTIPEETLVRAKVMRESGLSYRLIAKKLKLPVSTVHDAMTRSTAVTP